MSKLLSGVVILAIAGCSNQSVYESQQINLRNECLRAPLPTYVECMEKAGKSYEQYERERAELLRQSSQTAKPQ